MEIFFYFYFYLFIFFIYLFIFFFLPLNPQKGWIETSSIFFCIVDAQSIIQLDFNQLYLMTCLDGGGKEGEWKEVE